MKQQLRRADIAFDSLDNGFLACADPTRLQAICDQLGPADVQAFFDRRATRLPAPATAADRAAGYTHRLALQQVEVSLTQVFARPVQGRHFFEAVIRENLDLGRPTGSVSPGGRRGRVMRCSKRSSVDLRRLRLKGLVHRMPKTHRYTATTYGLKVAFFSAKLYLRILRPEWPALLPADDLPRPLRAALDKFDAQIRKIHEEAVLAA